MQDAHHNQERDEETDGSSLPDLPGISLTPHPLSRGPAGTVYRGWDHVHHCAVVVKTQRGSMDRVAADRFRREATVMARLRHPNIVALYRFYDGDPSALVMEYVPGRTLADLVTTGGPLAPAKAVGIIEGVAAALDRIHLEGIVHRDVKPANILLPPHGPAKLTDFGVARADGGVPLTVVGDILGTIEYVSPEQIHGETVPDARSDVYSLAAVTYFALTGKPPFPALDASTQAQLSVMHRQVFSDPPPLHRAGLSTEVEAAVLRGLAKAPDERPASAGQFVAGLRSAVEAGLGTPEEQATTAASRRTAGLASAAVGAVLLLLGGVATWQMQQPASTSGPSRPPFGPSSVAASSFPPPAPKLAAKPTLKPVPNLAAKTAPTPVRVAVAASLQERHPALQEHRLALQERRLSPVTERHRFRRHPDVVARTVSPAPFRPAAKMARRFVVTAPLPAVLGQPWRSIYANQNTFAFHARTVIADGVAMPSLAPGGWAALPIAPPFRSLLAAAPLVPIVPKRSRPVTVAAPSAVGWYTLSGWAASAVPAGGKPTLVRAPAQWVKVDNQPVPALAYGGWATLPAGRHTVTFQPALGLGVGPKTWNIELAAQGHLQQQIPLPPAAPAPVGWYTVSGWIAPNSSAPKPDLIRVSAQWVKVDGQPVLGLALGRWATLPAGRHTVTLQPTPGLGLLSKTWDINLAPQAHLDQKIPFPTVVDSK